MKRLSQKQIIMMHKQLVEQTGGSDKVLNYDLLDSALENPFQAFDGKELYEIILDIAASKKEYTDLLNWVIGHMP